MAAGPSTAGAGGVGPVAGRGHHRRAPLRRRASVTTVRTRRCRRGQAAALALRRSPRPGSRTGPAMAARSAVERTPTKRRCSQRSAARRPRSRLLWRKPHRAAHEHVAPGVARCPCRDLGAVFVDRCAAGSATSSGRDRHRTPPAPRPAEDGEEAVHVTIRQYAGEGGLMGGLAPPVRDGLVPLKRAPGFKGRCVVASEDRHVVSVTIFGDRQAAMRADDRVRDQPEAPAAQPARDAGPRGPAARGVEAPERRPRHVRHRWRVGGRGAGGGGAALGAGVFLT
jgi:hypothetical protein